MGGSTSAATIPMLARLKELKLRGCKLNRNALKQLAQLSSVTRLKLVGPLVEGSYLYDTMDLQPHTVKHLLGACQIW